MLKVSIRKTLNHFTLTSDFSISNGITGIIGPSGCGKSVTLQCIAGLQAPDDGEIILNEQTLFHNQRINMKTKDRNVGYVFQNYALFPHLTVQQNIAYGLTSESKSKKKEKVASMLSKVQLEGYEHSYPSELSGGQQQRVALARTLITEPALLLLDEPFSALDHHVKHLLEQELLAIIKQHYSGMVILVTHDMEEAYRLCDHVLIYDQGTIVQAGEKKEVFKKPVNRTAATIIGCKNMFLIDSLHVTDNEATCTIKGMHLTLSERPSHKEPGYIGIHAGEIQFVEKTSETNNAFNYKIIDIVMGIDRTHLTVQVGDVIIKATTSSSQIERITSRNLHIYLPPEQLFFLQK
ncbi:sulfate/molybdate ABC transporter ATP-binding protein [Halalkalibacter kiskunsagensis]|uniref:Sulfate/molybdate ABC transporter ATP-binding protein n=1 Tax=Halalkalibacter kiskunsagensis TaxID=1548599 RepID=A0ABV6KE66_9BACI